MEQKRETKKQQPRNGRNAKKQKNSDPQLRPELANPVADGPDGDSWRRLRREKLELAGHSVGSERHF